MQRLELSISSGLKLWLQPHMLGYKEITTSERTKSALDAELPIVAEELGVEYIHLHGNFQYLFAERGERWYIKVGPKEIFKITGRVHANVIRPEIQATPATLATQATPVIQATRNATNTNTAPVIENSVRTPAGRSGAVRYSRNEMIMFVRGVNTFRDDKNMFAKIAACNELGFVTGDFGKVRTNVNLKDLYRTMEKNGSLLIDSASGQAYYKDATLSECQGFNFDFVASTTQSTRSGAASTSNGARRNGRIGAAARAMESVSNSSVDEPEIEYNFAQVTARCYAPTPRFDRPPAPILANPVVILSPTVSSVAGTLLNLPPRPSPVPEPVFTQVQVQSPDPMQVSTSERWASPSVAELEPNRNLTSTPPPQVSSESAHEVFSPIFRPFQAEDLNTPASLVIQQTFLELTGTDQFEEFTGTITPAIIAVMEGPKKRKLIIQ
jgi:hypothetical protein